MTRPSPGPPTARRSTPERSPSSLVESEAAGNCRDVNFDPLMLPSGIAPSDDPLLVARSAVYAASFARREGENKQPGAVRTGNRRE